jgi:hypothetical protein
MAHDHEPCGVAGFPALVVSARGFCSVHEGARRAKHVMAGTRCPLCGRLVDAEEWVTEYSTAAAMTHAHCPPKRSYGGRKSTRPKPLLDEPEATNGR